MNQALSYLPQSVEDNPPPAVDLITYDSDEDEYVLHLVDCKNVSIEAPHDDLLEFEDRVLGYLGYVLSRDMEKEFPDALSRPMRFQLDCFERPRKEAADILKKIADQLSVLGIGFRVKIFD
jgi:hypothetical protein